MRQTVTNRKTNFGNYVPAGWNQYGQEGGMTLEGEKIPASAMMEILALRKELSEVLIDKPLPLHIAQPKGETMTEMRANINNNELYQMGDAVLFWINEGDLSMLTVYGNVVVCKDIK